MVCFYNITARLFLYLLPGYMEDVAGFSRIAFMVSWFRLWIKTMNKHKATFSMSRLI